MRQLLTRWYPDFQGFLDIDSLGVAHRFELFVIIDLHIRAQIVRCKAKMYAKILVAKDFFLFTEDWISEVWVKC